MDGIAATIWTSQTTLPPAGRYEAWEPPLTAAAAITEKVNRATLTRLVRGGVAVEQAGVGDVLDVMQPGIERGGVVPGLAR
ncbi:MAG: hypothetical protein ACRDOD_06010 [Streptosporangiaceae bacterium]